MSKRVIVLVVAALLVGLAGAYLFLRKPPSLSGQTRADFVRSAVDGCIAKQKSTDEGKALPAETIERYCGCYGEKLADRMTQADIDRLSGATPEAMQTAMKPKMDDAGAVCSATIE